MYIKRLHNSHKIFILKIGGKMSTTENCNLTKREKQVLMLLVRGKNNPEISEILNISINTVKAHCKSIFDKLEVNSRVDAVIKAIILGIIWL